MGNSKGTFAFYFSVAPPPSPQFLAGCCSGYFPEEDEGKGLSFPVKKEGRPFSLIIPFRKLVSSGVGKGKSCCFLGGGGFRNHATGQEDKKGRKPTTPSPHFIYFSLHAGGQFSSTVWLIFHNGEKCNFFAGKCDLEGE